LDTFVGSLDRLNGRKLKDLSNFQKTNFFDPYRVGMTPMDEIPAVSAESLDVALADIPFEGMWTVVRAGGNLDDWNQVFAEIVKQVSARVRAKFSDKGIADSAARSAMATVLRRARDGTLDRVDGPDAFIGQVVLAAHHKAWQKIKTRWRHLQIPEGFDPVDTSTTRHPEPDPDPLVPPEAIRSEMASQLKAMLTRMNLLLKSDHRRQAFELLYRKMYGIERLTDAQIAARIGIAERTVRRVRREVEAHWPRVVEDGRRAVQALEARLRRLAET
jgi:DNA-directed RNA polymerase specialized sigma24 family protein